MADEQKTINNADEVLSKELYGISDDLIKRDYIDELRKKARGISNRNTSNRDSNGMMNTLIEIMANQQAKGGLTISKGKKANVDSISSFRKLIGETLGLSGDFGMGDTKRINRYNDYRVIDEYIPEMSTSLDVLRDSILSPDDFTKQSAFYIYDDGSADKTLNEQDRVVFESKIEELDEKFGLSQFIKESSRDTLLLGDDFTIVRPIKDEFLKVLTEQTNSDLDYLIEDSGSYITEDIYQDSLMEDLSAFLTEASKGLIYDRETGNTKTDPTELITGVVKSVKDNLLVVKNPEVLLSDHKRAYKDLESVRGAYFKHVRPDDIIKLELDHVCIGYLYFDRSVDQSSSNILGRNTTNTTLLQAMTSALNSDSESSGTSSSTEISSVGGMSFGHTDGGKLAVEGNTAKAYDALVRLFSRGISEKINKRFLEDNHEFREVILSLLKNDYLITKKVAVTYLEPDDVIHNKLDSSETYGKSLYKNGLFFAKLYLINTLNTMMIKINQGRDKRVYYVENGLDDDFEGIIEGLGRDLRRKEVPTNALSNENSVSTVMRQVGSLESYYIPVNNGERAFDIDVIPGMQVDVDESDLDRLLRSAQRSTGVPYNYIDASTDIDFSRTIAIQNQGFVKNILTYQSTFSKYYTEIVQRLWRYEFEDEKAILRHQTSKSNEPSPESQEIEGTDNIQSEFIKVQFPAPVTLNATTIGEQISATEQIIEFLTTLHYGDEDDTNRDSRRVFRKNLSKDVYLRNINWNMIEQVKTSTDEEVKRKEIEKAAEPEGEGEDSFNYQ